jgi:hypothetical protein
LVGRGKAWVRCEDGTNGNGAWGLAACHGRVWIWWVV